MPMGPDAWAYRLTKELPGWFCWFRATRRAGIHIEWYALPCPSPAHRAQLTRTGEEARREQPGLIGPCFSAAQLRGLCRQTDRASPRPESPAIRRVRRRVDR